MTELTLENGSHVMIKEMQEIAEFEDGWQYWYSKQDQLWFASISTYTTTAVIKSKALEVAVIKAKTLEEVVRKLWLHYFSVDKNHKLDIIFTPRENLSDGYEKINGVG